METLRNAGCSRQRQAAVEPAAYPTLGVAGSLVLRLINWIAIGARDTRVGPVRG